MCTEYGLNLEGESHSDTTLPLSQPHPQAVKQGHHCDLLAGPFVQLVDRVINTVQWEIFTGKNFHCLTFKHVCVFLLSLLTSW